MEEISFGHKCFAPKFNIFKGFTNDTAVFTYISAGGLVIILLAGCNDVAVVGVVGL